MTYQVLARKWRPRDFESLVGQQHVVRALTHALGSGRLHHAYLLTGTRGVGKTTIARILAKALNCETGPTATPCGRCSACTGIDGGRFVDYIEMDAASNRGVDEMTQLLENAIYAPTAGRYKVYVIDEVHMLSTHAFNAMLKTLEEPPAHVIFVLATTDPQKVPVTVLSRCLQFNLKNMTPSAIAEHLAHVLRSEGIDFEPTALPPIGRAAGGSMRDALSLLDQAIAFGGGGVAAAAVRDMLGVVDQGWITSILDALASGEGPALIGLADPMQLAGAPFERVLDELALRLHRVALAQAGVLADDEWRDEVARHASLFAPEDVQVFYQIVIHGARDLALAPDPQAGFSMVLLRLLAFRPDATGRGALAESTSAPAPAVQRPALRSQMVSSGSRAPAVPPSAMGPSGPRPTEPVVPASPESRPLVPVAPTSSGPRSSSTPGAASPGLSEPQVGRAPPVPAPDFDGDWPALARRLGLGGFAGQFMGQSELLGREGDVFQVRVPIRPLAEVGTVNKVREALSAHFGRPVRLTVEVGAVAGVTAVREAQREQGEQLEQAREALEADPFVRSLVSGLDGRIVPGSVTPVRDDQ